MIRSDAERELLSVSTLPPGESDRAEAVCGVLWGRGKGTALGRRFGRLSPHTGTKDLAAPVSRRPID